MPFVSRDDQGNISGVSDNADPNFPEEISADHPDLIRYVTAAALSSKAIRDELAQSDFKMVRLVDDLIDLLIDRGVIQFTDLPPAAGEKYLQRQGARHRLQTWSSLIVDEKDIL